MKSLLYPAILIILMTSCSVLSDSGQDIPAVPHYDMTLRLNPDTGHIEVAGTLNIPEPVPNPLTFYLARTMTIRAFSTNGGHTMTVDRRPSDVRFMPEAMRVTLHADEEKSSNGPLVVTFAYAGDLPVLPPFFANIVGEDWTEIGMYYPWFPLEWKQVRLYTYRVSVETGTSDTVFGLGETRQVGGDWIMSSDTPTNDIVVCASPDIRHFEQETGAFSLSIYHRDLSDNMLDRMGSELGHILTLEQDWFGGAVGHVSIVISGRKKGGGYARIGGVVLGGLDESDYETKNADYQRYFAHELGHLWWYRAPTDTWEDWLNESFAEYSALMVIRGVFGQGEFDRRLAEKRESSQGTPPIRNFDRNHADWKLTNRVLYDKGPVLLSELEARMGTRSFLAFCRDLQAHRVDITGSLLNQLTKQTDRSTADWFQAALRQ